MATQQELSSLLPLPIMSKDLNFNPFPLPIPPDVLQLQTDTINVLNGSVALGSFSSDYQEKIRNYWRFSAMFQTSKENNIANRTPDTLDIV
jgi:hypothetical protein